MEHAAVALYVAVALAGSWVTIFSFLLFRREGNRAYFYFGLVLGSAMVILLVAILFAYVDAIGVSSPLWLRVIVETTDAIAELVQFFAMIRLAYAIVRLAVPRAVASLQIAAMVAYVGMIAYSGISRVGFDVRHVALGVAHLAFVVIVVYHRRRIEPILWNVLVKFAVVTVVCAPLIGISVYSGVAQRLPLGDLAFQFLYGLITIVMLNWFVIRYYFPRRCPDVHGCAEELGEPLSPREQEIAVLAGKGYTNKEIGALLHISPRTVTNHLYHIYQKFGVRNRVELKIEVERLP